jgi:hypothetical protein
MGLVEQNVAFIRQFKRERLDRLARACGITSADVDKLEPFVQAATYVFACRSELLEGVTVTPEILEAVRVTTLPVVEAFNELSNNVSEISRQISLQSEQIETLISENNALLAVLAEKLGLHKEAEAAMLRRLRIVTPTSDETPEAV